MKKIIAVVITILTLCITVSACADSVQVVLGNHARIAGPKNETELNEFSAHPSKANISSTLGGLGKYGPVLRSKTMVKNTSFAFSTVDLYLKDCDYAILEKLGINPDVASIVEATRIEKNDTVGHRFSTDDDAYLTAILVTKNGKPIQVVATDWDNNGSLDLCFLPGTSDDMGYNWAPKAISDSSSNGTGNSGRGPVEHSSNSGNDGGSSSSSSGRGAVSHSRNNY